MVDMPFNLYSVFNGFKCGDIMNDLSFQNNYPCYKGLPLEDAELVEIGDALKLVISNIRQSFQRLMESVLEACRNIWGLFGIKYRTESIIGILAPEHWLKWKYKE